MTYMAVTKRMARCRVILLMGWWALALNGGTALGDPTLIPSSTTPTPTPSASEYQRGQQLVLNRHFSEAAKAFQKSAQLDPSNVYAYLGLAEVSVATKQEKAAAGYLKKALSVAPRNPHAHRAWGRYLLTQNKYAEAEAAFTKAISFDSTFWEAQMDLGNVRAAALKKPREAIAAYRAAVASDHTRWPAYYALALQLVHVGEQTEAHQAFAKARELAHSDPRPAFDEGRLFLKEGKQDEALKAFSAAIKTDPKHAPSLVARAEITRVSKHKPEEAIEDYRAAIQQAPTHVQAHIGLGLSLAQAGRSSEAVDHLQTAARLKPRDAGIWYELGRLHREQHRADDAMNAFETALKLDPKHVPALVALADAHWSRGQFDKAKDGYATALRVRPSATGLQIKLAMAYIRQQAWEDAQKLLEAVIDREPQNAVALNSMAWLAVERNQDLDAALSWSRKAVDLQPKNATFYDTLGWVYRARGELTRASANLEAAAKLDPTDPVIHYHLGILYAEQTNKEKAKESLSKAMSLQQNFDGAADARERLNQLRR